MTTTDPHATASDDRETRLKLIGHGMRQSGEREQADQSPAETDRPTGDADPA